MRIREIQIRSVGELIEAVTPADPDPASGRHLVAIDERHLFPGLGGVAAAIRRYYA